MPFHVLSDNVDEFDRRSTIYDFLSTLWFSPVFLGNGNIPHLVYPTLKKPIADYNT